ncbi:hypothetical protein [Curtobacterium sp. Leaf261]|uniref:hypothetical protein n=1 Tax=Curtobacterium sp. Leaf261 TaxID=1736311 RepID=UPI0006F52FC1|nr:hypothetical protein [Curtobacterium sp. Leaf261]KQO64208.1 hypothetical protein ASF23_16730 [Curtobacterium sp. Leaf261]
MSDQDVAYNKLSDALERQGETITLGAEGPSWYISLRHTASLKRVHRRAPALLRTLPPDLFLEGVVPADTWAAGREHADTLDTIAHLGVSFMGAIAGEYGTVVIRTKGWASWDDAVDVLPWISRVLEREDDVASKLREHGGPAPRVHLGHDRQRLHGHQGARGGGRRAARSTNRPGDRRRADSVPVLFRARPSAKVLTSVSCRKQEELAPREHVEKALAFLTRTPEEHRAAAAKAGVLVETAGQYDYNPLRDRPFVDFGPGTGIVAPEPRLVWRAISIQNLYYVGPDYFGSKAFHEQLGKRLESYVGRQLRLIDGADVTGEVPLDSENKMSIDWFLVLPDLIVLVECKSARLNAKALAGDAHEIARATTMYLAKARDQIDATARKVGERDKRVSFLPDDDRPVVGLIVTAEPIHLANSGQVEYGRQGETLFIVLSLADLEGLVGVPAAELSSRLAGVFQDEERRTWGFPQSFGKGLEAWRNPIIVEAKNRFAFLRDQRDG